MRILKYLFAAVLLLAAAASILSFNKGSGSESREEAREHFQSGKNNLKCLYYDETDFVNIRRFGIKDVNGSIRGCILPHHLTASDLIHEVFQNVSSTRYKTVVLIGPDHESLEKGKVFTTLRDWQAPAGILETDREITGELLKNSFVLADDGKLTSEHSVSGIIPFIRYYMGDVKVVTLVLTKQAKPEDIDRLIEDLYEHVNAEETLFIASVDFSHYLDLDEADRMDSITMDAIEKRDIEKIMSFTNDNLDSPVSIAMLLKMMDKLNAGNAYLLNHSNSELILKVRSEETTSYLTYLFY